MDDEDDLAGQFSTAFDAERQRAIDTEFQRLLEPDAAEPGAEPLGAAPAGETGPAVASGPGEPNVLPEAPEGLGDVSPETSQAPEPDEAGRQGLVPDWVPTDAEVYGTIGAVAKDVLLGTVEVPLQSVGGAADAVNETLQAMESLDSMINQTLGLPEFEGYGRLPTTAAADTVTGGFVRSTAQFLTGFIPAMKGVKAVKGLASLPSLAKGMTAGAIADMVVFDPHEDRLSTYLNEVPLLAPVVSDYLAENDPTKEGEWEGRLKNAVEGAGLGLAADSLVTAFKYYKRARATNREAKAAAMSQRDLGAAAARDAIRNKATADIVAPLEPGALDNLGLAEPDAPLVLSGDTMRQAVAIERDARDLRLIQGSLPEGMTARFTKDGVSVIGPAGRRVGVVDRPQNVDESALAVIGQRIEQQGAADAALKGVADRVKEAGEKLGFVGLDEGKRLGLDQLGPPDARGRRTRSAAVLIDGQTFVANDHQAAIGKAVAKLGPGVEARIDADPEAHLGFLRKPEADPLDELLNAARSGMGPDPDLKYPAKPVLRTLIKAGGVKPGSPLAQALNDRGVNTRTYPGRLWNRNGIGAADNLVASEHPEFRAVGGEEGGAQYVDPDDLIAALDEELMGAPRRAADQVEERENWEIANRNADEFRQDLARLGVDFDTMSNDAIRRRLADVEAEQARIRDIEETPSARGEEEFGDITVAERGGARSGEVWSPEEIAEARAVGVDQAVIDAHSPGPRIFINHARINTTDDVKALIQQTADADADAINAKRRGVVSNKQTLAESQNELTRLEDLIGRKPGPMGAAEAVAARKLLTASGEQLVGLATKANMADASSADLYAFKRAMQVHYAIQAEVIAARTETARALQSWAIPAGSSKRRAEQISEMLTQTGGAADVQRLAAQVALLANNPEGLGQFVRQSAMSRVRDVAFEYWINGLLSSPKTHVVNALSNTLTTLWNIPERYLASGISNAFYGGEVQSGEAAAQAWGMVASLRDAGRFMLDASANPHLADTFNKAEIIEPAIRSQRNDIFGTAINYLGMAIRTPGAALDMSDRFFKAVNYRAELQALAFRESGSEGLTGADQARRMAEIIADSPATLVDQATEVAERNTFTRQLGEAGQLGQRFANSMPGVRLVVPFIRTPVNILKFTFERTPLAYVSKRIQADLHAGGARAAQTHARVAAGSMLFMAMADYAASGVISGYGPQDPVERKRKMETGWKPYSVRFGDRYYTYNRLDPLGLLAGLGADIGEIIGNLDEPDADKLTAAAAATVTQNLASKTWSQGAFGLVGALDPSNPRASIGDYLTEFAGGAVPFSGLLRHVRNSIADPMLRDVKVETPEDIDPAIRGIPEPLAMTLQDMINQYRKNIPGLGEDLPPRTDLWGRSIDTATGVGWVYDFLSPVGGAKADDDPASKVIVDNRIKVNMPQRTVRGVKLSAEEYFTLMTTAGPVAHEAVSRLIKMPVFDRLSDGPDGGKAELIKREIDGAFDQARQMMLVREPRLRQRWLEQERDQRTMLQMGAGQ